MAENQADVEARLRPFRVLPGGAQAIPDEWYAAAVMLGALLLLWVLRRNLGHEEGHVHISGTAAIIFVLYYLIVTGIVVPSGPLPGTTDVMIGCGGK